MSGKRGCLFSLLLLLLAFALVRIFSAQILAGAARCLIESDTPRKADAAVVLGGDGYGDRTLKGAELAKAGYVPVVVVSGSKNLVRYESGDEIEYAEQHGYPASLFREAHLPGDAESTRAEAQFVGRLLQQQGIHSILLVTSNFHSRRAAKLWRQQNPQLTITVIPSVDPERYFSPETWWKTRAGKKIFLYEWMKTVSLLFGI